MWYDRTAGFDRITGEWTPEEWKSDESAKMHFYPPYRTDYGHAEIMRDYGTDDWTSAAPHPELKTTSIGKGQLYNGYVDASVPNGMDATYTVYGRTKGKEEANKICDSYDALHNIPGYSGRNITPIHNDDGENVGYNWSSSHTTPIQNIEIGKDIIEAAHQRFSKMFGQQPKLAGYNRITGEWEPEQWEHFDPHALGGVHYYPPRKDNSNEINPAKHDSFEKNYPNPYLRTTNIGRGHVFHATAWNEDNYAGNVGRYHINGVSPTLQDAYHEMDRYFSHYVGHYGIDASKVIRREYPDGEFNPVEYWKHGKSPEVYDDAESHACGTAKELHDHNGNSLGYSWNFEADIPLNERLHGPLNNIVPGLKNDVERLHKELYDMNNGGPQIRFAKVYRTAIDENGNPFTVVADRMSPEEVGPGFSGTEQPVQTVGADIDPTYDNQPQGVDATIPSANSFYTTLSYKEAAKPPEFVPYEEQPTGLPRPTVNTAEHSWFYDENSPYSAGERKLYKKIPMPWDINDWDPESEVFDMNSDINPQDGDLSHSKAYMKNACPMCGEVFKGNEPTVALKEAGSSPNLDNLLPYHEKCMQIIKRHCPGVRDRDNSEFIYGTSEELRDRARQQFLNIYPNVTDEMNEKNSSKIPTHCNFCGGLNHIFKTAEIEDTNYEGVGSVFGEGMGPQDLSNNVTDVEEGPRTLFDNNQSLREQPASLQGRAVLPNLTSWYSASKHFNDEDYEYKNHDEQEQDYDDNYTWE